LGFLIHKKIIKKPLKFLSGFFYAKVFRQLGLLGAEKLNYKHFIWNLILQNFGQKSKPFVHSIPPPLSISG